VKEKEKVFAALSHLPQQHKNMFFINGNEWSKESQEKFLKQFNKKEFETINKDLSYLKNVINEIIVKENKIKGRHGNSGKTQKRAKSHP
jgi:hypothetical protein